MSRKYWTETDLEILRNEYYSADKEELTRKLNRTSWLHVVQKANKLGLRRANTAYFTTTVHRLLEETPEAYYWAGFILADGHIQPRGQLAVTIAIKDAAHLEKLAAWLGCNVSYKEAGRVSLRVMDVVTMKAFCAKFGIDNNKTYTGAVLPVVSDELLLSLIVGFIDGDGCIRKQFGRNDSVIVVKCHANWKPMLQFFTDTVNRISGLSMPDVRLEGCGYAQAVWSDSRALKILRRFVEQHNLPVLSRKWDLIDLNYVSKVEKAAERLARAVELKTLGYNHKQVMAELGMTKCGLSALYARNGLKFKKCPKTSSS